MRVARCEAGAGSFAGGRFSASTAPDKRAQYLVYIVACYAAYIRMCPHA